MTDTAGSGVRGSFAASASMLQVVRGLSFSARCQARMRREKSSSRRITVTSMCQYSFGFVARSPTLSRTSSHMQLQAEPISRASAGARGAR